SHRARTTAGGPPASRIHAASRPSNSPSTRHAVASPWVVSASIASCRAAASATVKEVPTSPMSREPNPCVRSGTIPATRYSLLPLPGGPGGTEDEAEQAVQRGRDDGRGRDREQP